MIRHFVICAILLTAACGSLPRDVDGTLERVQRERHFRVGIIANGSTPSDTARVRAFLTRVAHAAGAEPALKVAASEPLLMELEEGRLDLVVGELSPGSPWLGRVALLPPIGETVEPRHLVLTPAARNGENRWIMLLEREGRSVAAADTP